MKDIINKVKQRNKATQLILELYYFKKIADNYNEFLKEFIKFARMFCPINGEEKDVGSGEETFGYFLKKIITETKEIRKKLGVKVFDYMNQQFIKRIENYLRGVEGEGSEKNLIERTRRLSYYFKELNDIFSRRKRLRKQHKKLDKTSKESEELVKKFKELFDLLKSMKSSYSTLYKGVKDINDNNYRTKNYKKIFKNYNDFVEELNKEVNKHKEVVNKINKLQKKYKEYENEFRTIDEATFYELLNRAKKEIGEENITNAGNINDYIKEKTNIKIEENTFEDIKNLRTEKAKIDEKKIYKKMKEKFKDIEELAEINNHFEELYVLQRAVIASKKAIQENKGKYASQGSAKSKPDIETVLKFIKDQASTKASIFYIEEEIERKKKRDELEKEGETVPEKLKQRIDISEGLKALQDSIDKLTNDESLKDIRSFLKWMLDKKDGNIFHELKRRGIKKEPYLGGLKEEPNKDINGVSNEFMTTMNLLDIFINTYLMYKRIYGLYKLIVDDFDTLVELKVLQLEPSAIKDIKGGNLSDSIKNMGDSFNTIRKEIKSFCKEFDIKDTREVMKKEGKINKILNKNIKNVNRILNGLDSEKITDRKKKEREEEIINKIEEFMESYPVIIEFVENISKECKKLMSSFEGFEKTHAKNFSKESINRALKVAIEKMSPES